MARDSRPIDYYSIIFASCFDDVYGWAGWAGPSMVPASQLLPLFSPIQYVENASGLFVRLSGDMLLSGCSFSRGKKEHERPTYSYSSTLRGHDAGAY